jgi:hypothetical protein
VLERIEIDDQRRRVDFLDAHPGLSRRPAALSRRSAARKRGDDHDLVAGFSGVARLSSAWSRLTNSLM